MKGFIGIGNALVDALYPVANDDFLDELHFRKGSMQLIDQEQYWAISDKMKGGAHKRTTGGSACNTILALAHLNAPTALIGKVSADENGHFFSEEFNSKGIITHLLDSSLPTGVASTFITPDGQRTFGTYLGAAAELTPQEINPKWLTPYSYLYIEGYLVQNNELTEYIVKVAHEAGLLVCLDMASFNIVEAERDFFAKLLPQIDIVFANEDEARAFTGTEPEEALSELAKICHVAVVKIGKKGAMACCGANTAVVPAGNAPVVRDTTAAGDYFAAGFLYAHAQNRSLRDALTAGTILANEIVQVIGTGLSEETWESIRKEVCKL